jgi:hypothetical protein
MQEELMGSGGVCCQAQGLPRAQQACLQLIITMCANALGAPGTKYTWEQALGIPHASVNMSKRSRRKPHKSDCQVGFHPKHTAAGGTCSEPIKITSAAFASSLSRRLFPNALGRLEAALKPETQQKSLTYL